MIYLDVDVRPFPFSRKDKGYYIFIDRMKEGTANVIERNVLECGQRSDITNKVKEFLVNYKKVYHYLKLWNSTFVK